MGLFDFPTQEWGNNTYDAGSSFTPTALDFNSGGGNGSSPNWIQDLPSGILGAFGSIANAAVKGIGEGVGDAARAGIPKALGITSVTQQTPIPSSIGAIFSSPTTWIVIGLGVVALILVARR